MGVESDQAGHQDVDAVALVQLADGLQHRRREVLVRLKVRLEVRKDLCAVWLAPEDVQALGEEPLLQLGEVLGDTARVVVEEGGSRPQRAAPC